MVIINIYNVKWKRRYTRKELSELTGFSPAALTKLTKGEHVDVKISTLENLAKFFDCRVVDLIEEVPD